MPEETTQANTAVISEDEILDSILDKAGMSKEKSFYNEDGKMTPRVLQTIENKQLDGKESEAKQVVKEEKPDSSENTARPQDTSPELKAAYKALRRDGVPYSLLDKMSTDNPEELLEWAEKARKRQEDVDTRLGKGGETSDSNEAKDEEESKEEVASEKSSENTDNDTITKIKEQFGDEASEPLLQLNSQLQRQNEVLQEQINAMQQSQLSNDLATSERVLAGLWPDLSTNRDSIHKRMAQIGNEHPNQFSSVDQMMFAAAVDVLGLPKSQENVTQQPNQSAAEPDPRDLGQPAKKSGGDMPEATRSTADRNDAALEAILDGKGVEEAKRAFYQS